MPVEPPELFEGIYPTTWFTLVDKGYLTCNHWYALTPAGWVKTLEVMGKLSDDQLKQDLGELLRVLKDRIERTKEHACGALVGLDEVVTETGFPEHWLSNVIDSHLIAVVLKRKDAYWAPGAEIMKTDIEVPINIGHSLV